MYLKPPKDFLIRNCIDKNNIFKNSLIHIDNCLVNEIKDLWNKGIHTLGCCCGHNKHTGFIQIERTDIDKMLKMNYEWYEYENDKNRCDAFVPKSKCKCNNIVKERKYR